MLKLLTGLAILGVQLADAQLVDDVIIIPEPFNELPCLISGGVCLDTEDCHDAELPKILGLCPVQQRSGIECCVPTRKGDLPERRCIDRGGECFDPDTRCPDYLIYKEATDCKPGWTCCVLVD